MQYIKDLGFPSTSIVDNGNEFIVEEDITFPKNMEIPANGVGTKTEQYYTGSIVNSTKKLNIRIFVDPSMTSMSSEINSAIAQWNGVPNSTLRFSIVTTAPYDILIKDENLGNGVCGQGQFLREEVQVLWSKSIKVTSQVILLHNVPEQFVTSLVTVSHSDIPTGLLSVSQVLQMYLE
ncbi:hypothetical protein [Pedobacter sp. P26]|uniref:hypothetical protein n=1 Tax=Pedobacter sp. P26 TaxID=3423956 RepID=UPI003D6792E1